MHSDVAGRSGDRPFLPSALLTVALKHHYLIGLMVRRNVEASFRGAVLGIAWAVLAPLLRLALYTFVFGMVLQVRWPGPLRSPFEVALLYFTGLTLFDFFFDCLNIAPTLMLDHANFVKKVVFPLEILSFVVVGASLVRFAITATVLLVFYLAIDGIPGPAALSIPLVMLPLILVTMGLVWLMALAGTYVRDLRQLIVLFAMIAMWLSPIFFPMSKVPAFAQPVFYANPLTFVIESARGALFAGQWPNWLALGLYAAGAWLFATLALGLFLKAKAGFADVV
jgi:lipopolysaccharide transport system permease protein